MEDYMMMWGRGFVMFHLVTGRWHIGSGRNVEMHEIRKSECFPTTDEFVVSK